MTVESLNLLKEIHNLFKDPDNYFLKIQEDYKDNKKLIEWLSSIYSEIKENFYTKTEIENFIDRVNKLLIHYAKHRYSKELQLTDDEIFDTLITAINFLGQELNHSTVTTHYLHDIFGSIGDIILVVNKQGNIMFVNPACCKMLEYSESELKRMNISKLISGNINIKKLLAGQNDHHSYEFVSLNGVQIPVVFKISDFSRPDNPMLGYVLVGRDLTLINEFRKTREDYKLLFDNISQGFVLAEKSLIIDTDSLELIIKNVNPSLEKHLGLSVSELIEKPLGLLWNNNNSFSNLSNEVAKGHGRHHFEHYFEHLDKYFDIWMFSPEIGKCAVLFSDITDRKMAEAMYINNRSRYLYLLNNTSQMLVLFGIDGRILDINKKLEDDTGFNKNELFQSYVQDLFKEIIKDTFNEKNWFKLGLFEKRICEVSYRKKNKQERLLEIQFSKIVVDENECFLALAQDITERREQELLINKMNKRLIEINQYAENLNLIDSEFLHSYIVKSLRSIAGVSFALINTYEEETKELVCRKISYNNFDYKKISSILGRQVEGYRTYVPENMLALMQNEIIGEAGTLTDVTFGQINGFVSGAISKLTGISWFLGISLSKEKKFLGTILLGGRKNEPQITREEFLAFSGITSNALIRIQAEKQLKESERRMSTLIDNLPGIAYRCKNDQFFSMDFLSKGVKEVTGYEANELINNNVISYYDIIHPDDVLDVKTKWDEALSEKKKFIEEYRIINKSGQIKWVWEQGTGVYKDDKIIALEGFITDITEKKEKERKIIQSQNKLQSIFKGIPIGLGTVSERIITEANSRISELTGYSPTELIGRSTRFLFQNEEDFRSIETHIYPQANLKGVAMCETCWLRKDEKVIDIILSLAPIEIDDLSLGYIFSVLDITKIKEAQKALIISEEKYRHLAENVSDVIWQTDIELNVRYVSSSIKKLTGESPEEHMSKNLREKFKAEDEVKIFDIINDEIQSDQLHHADLNRSRIIEIEMKHSQGHYIWVSMNVTFLRNEKGKIIGLQGTSRDVTERKLIEAELEKSNRVFLHSLDMLCIAGVDGFLKVINPAWEKSLGWTKDELYSRPWIEFVHPEDREKTLNIKVNNIDNGITLFSYESRYLCKDGSYKWLSWNSFPYNEENILVGVARDITERKKEEEILQSHYTLMKIAGESANFGGWSVDLKENKVFWSDVVADIHEEPHGKSPLVSEGISYYAPEYRKKITEVFTKCINDGTPYDEVFEIITAKGNRKWVRTIGEALRNQDEKIIKIFGAFQDVTKTKEDELRLKEATLQLSRSVENWDKTFDAIQDAIALIDDHQNIVQTNQAFRSLFLRDHQKIIGKKCYLYVHEDQRSHCNCPYSRMLKSGKREVMEMTIRNRICSVMVDPILDNNKIIGAVHIISDITEQKEAQLELEHANYTYRLVSEKITDVVWLMNLEGRCLFVSPSIERFTGFTPDEYVSQNFDQCLMEKSAEIAKEVFSKKLSEYYNNPDLFFDFNLRLELEYQCKNGEAKWGELLITPYYSTDKTLLGLHGVTRDISERKKAESKLFAFHERQRVISDSIIILNSIDEIDQLIIMLGKIISNIINDAYIICARVRPENNDFVIVDQYGGEEFIDRISEIIGENYRNFSICLPKYSEKQKKSLIEGKLLRMNDKLKSLLGERLSLKKCRKIEQLLGITSVSLSGIFIGDKLFGSISLLHKNYNFNYEQQDFVSTIIQNASVIIQSKWYANELRLSHLRYKTFFDSSNSMVFLKDASLNYLLVNEAFTKFIGKTERDIIGKNDNALLEKKVAEICRNNDLKALSEGDVVIDFESFGESIYQSIKFRVPLSNGETGIGGYITDVTKERQMENDLHLMNHLNELINKGNGIEIVIEQLHIFLKNELSTSYTAIFIFNEDDNCINISKKLVPPKLIRNIEKYFGVRLPVETKADIQEDNWYGKLFQNNTPRLESWETDLKKIINVWSINNTNEQKELCTKDSFADLNKNSIIVSIPMILNNEKIAVLHAFFSNPIDEFKTERLKRICEQLVILIDRKKGEEKLKQTQQLLKDTQNVSKLGGWSYTIENSHFSMTETLFEIFGDGSDRIIQKPEDILKFFSTSDAEKLNHAFRRLFSKGQSFNYEMMLHKFTGDKIWVRIIGSPFYIDRKISRGIGYIMNIDDRKKAEFSLLESEEKYRTLIEISTDGIFINQHNKIVYVNSAAVRLFGAKNENEILGKSPLVFFHHEFHDIINKRMENMLNDNISVLPLEEKIVRFDGRIIDVETSGTPFIFNEKPAIQVIIRDITERKHLQQALLNAVINSEEKERERIARELHDGIGPLLSTAKMVLQTHMMSSISDKTENDFGQKSLSLIDDAISGVSEISRNISPHVLNNYGLIKAIESFINKIRKSDNIRIIFNSDVYERFKNVIEISFYRIALELINNSLKHTQAKLIKLNIKKKNSTLVMHFFHNGLGFDWEMEMKKNEGMGLLNMYNRVKTLNGTLKWENLGINGMKVEIVMPV